MKPKKVKGYECEECGSFEEADALPEAVKGWECEGYEGASLTAPETQKGMMCPHCDEFIEGATPADGEQETREVCEQCADDPDCNEHEEKDVWELECGCIAVEQPALVEWFACSECEEAYEDREEAKECCKE